MSHYKIYGGVQVSHWFNSLSLIGCGTNVQNWNTITMKEPSQNYEFKCRHITCQRSFKKECNRRRHEQNKNFHTFNLPCIQCRQQPVDEQFLPAIEQSEEQLEEQNQTRKNEFQMYQKLSVEDCLSLKDSLTISDNGWNK